MSMAIVYPGSIILSVWEFKCSLTNEYLEEGWGGTSERSNVQNLFPFIHNTIDYTLTQSIIINGGTFPQFSN